MLLHHCSCFGAFGALAVADAVVIVNDVAGVDVVVVVAVVAAIVDSLTRAVFLLALELALRLVLSLCRCW